MTNPPSNGRERGVLALPLGPDVYARLEVPKRLSDAEWQQLMKVLAAFRPGLVTGASSEDEG